MIKEVNFHFAKSAHFRVIHVDGAHGGISPNGSCLNITVYNEMAPLPKEIIHKIADNGAIGEEVSRVSDAGVSREMEATLSMSLQTAASIRDWLSAQIEAADKLMKQMVEAAKLDAIKRNRG